MKSLCAVLFACLLCGCAAFNYTEKDAPLALTQVPQRHPKPKIAVVLGSGGPRGYAHIGVMRVLEDAGIYPDLIVGSSVGALLGTFWASGMSAKDIEAKALAGGPTTLFDFNPFADRGVIVGQRLQDYVATELKHPQLEQLRRPLVVVATERQNKEPRYFITGNAAVAVRASSAIPRIFSPVGINGVEYEDGDESLPVAVQAARDAGADFIIAVDVAAHPAATPATAPPGWTARDRTRRQRIDPEVAKADFLIHPDMGYYARPTQDYFVFALQTGYETARRLLPALQAKLAHK
ncbi:MAG: family protein RssA [Pseudomonadota bacterium]|jgi:NTE family protein